MVRAYPDIPDNSRDRLAKNHFLYAVESRSIREGINRGHPQNLDEAEQAALETETLQRVEQQRMFDGKPKMTRALDTSMEQRFGKIEEEMRSMVGLLAELSKQVQGQDAQSGEPVKKKQKSKEYRLVASNAIIVEKRSILPKKKITNQGNEGQQTGGPTRVQEAI